MIIKLPRSIAEKLVENHMFTTEIKKGKIKRKNDWSLYQPDLYACTLHYLLNPKYNENDNWVPLDYYDMVGLVTSSARTFLILYDLFWRLGVVERRGTYSCDPETLDTITKYEYRVKPTYLLEDQVEYEIRSTKVINRIKNHKRGIPPTTRNLLRNKDTVLKGYGEDGELTHTQYYNKIRSAPGYVKVYNNYKLKYNEISFYEWLFNEEPKKKENNE